MTSKKPEKLGKPLFKLDKKALRLFRPYRETPPIKVIDGIAKIADQPELRMLCAGLLVLGTARGDPRMIRAGARMLLAHEAANFAKNLIKHRIDRRRPRSEQSSKAGKPRKGRNTAKEMTSFPSGHSTGAMAVACAYAAQYPERRVPVLAAAGAIARRE
jgi:membrane-associated phospholipid phosphatase